jgi:hypothetical protein
MRSMVGNVRSVVLPEPSTGIDRGPSDCASMGSDISGLGCF